MEMEEMILYLVYHFGIILIWIDAEPMIILKELAGFKEEDYDNYGKIKAFIHRLIYCGFCSGFWITLLITQKLETAVIISTFYYMWDNRNI
jgi:hypothetical protein